MEKTNPLKSPILLIIIKFIALSLGLLFLTMGLGLFSIDYEQFTHIALSIADKPNWKDYFQTSVFPAQRFELIKILWLISVPVCLAVLGLTYKQAHKISSAIYSFFDKTKDILLQIYSFENNKEKWLVGVVFLLFLSRGIWQIYHYELQYDEAWTYNHFVSKGVLVSAISPNNNHIFYTLLASLFDWIPVASKYTLRLPVLLGGLCFGSIFYGLLRKQLGWKLALVSISFFLFSPAISFYSLYARGYIFQIGFTIIAWGALWRMVSASGSKSYYWSVYAIATILGIYSVPTHIYAWVATNVVFLLFWLTKNEDLSFRPWFVSNSIIVIVCVFLFAPLLLTNGLNILLGAASGQTVTGESFWEYQNRVSDWLLIGGGRGTVVYPYYCLLLLTTIGILYYYRTDKSKQFVAVSSLVFLLLPTLIGLIMGGHTPYRAWCFLTIFLALIPTLVLNIFRFYKYVHQLVGTTALILSSFTLWRAEVHYFIHWSEDLDRKAIDLAHVLLEHEVDTCYFFSNYDKPLLVYYYYQADKQLYAPMAFPSSKDYQPFLDSTTLYPAVLWDKEDYTPTLAEEMWLEKYYPVVWYQNQRVAIRAPQ